jgi:precorrin-6A/cobalt-precorrin-6A reductase
MTARSRILVLGGTVESVALAKGLADDPRVQIVTSLAGRNRLYRPPPGPVRVGGFGGIDGLIAYLRAEAVDLVVDATHPFAATMAAHAAQACATVGCPRLKIVRPPWPEQPGDCWKHVPSVAKAVSLLIGWQGRVFLTLGRQELDTFDGIVGPVFLARMIELPAKPPPPYFDVILDRGPFTVESETTLLCDWGVGLIVSKNSGGEATYAKLIAARQLSIPVIMVARPAMPAGDCVSTAEAAITWIGNRMS